MHCDDDKMMMRMMAKMMISKVDDGDDGDKVHADDR
jgi:hypothetical protein